MNCMKRGFLFLFILIFIFSCDNKIAKVNELGDLEGSPDVEVIKMESVFNTNSLMKIKISAPLAKNYGSINEPYTEFPKGIRFLIYDDQFAVISSMTADYAIYYINKKLWRAQGNVIIQNVQGGLLQTEELYRDDANEKIYSLKYVKVTDSDGSIVEGKGGFVSNFAFTNYEFKDVSGVFEEQIDL
jgi:LPS export ABC transporter protein LptC